MYKYLNEIEKIQVIFGFCFKIMSFSDLSKLPAIALELQEVIPNILKQSLYLFHTHMSTFIHVHKVAMKIS